MADRTPSAALSPAALSPADTSPRAALTAPRVEQCSAGRLSAGVTKPGEKAERIKALVAAEAWRDALSLAAKFPRLGTHEEAIRRGNEAMQRPGFQRQIGKCPETQIAAGIAALKVRYGNS